MKLFNYMAVAILSLTVYHADAAVITISGTAQVDNIESVFNEIDAENLNKISQIGEIINYSYQFDVADISSSNSSSSSSTGSTRDAFNYFINPISFDLSFRNFTLRSRVFTSGGTGSTTDERGDGIIISQRTNNIYSPAFAAIRGFDESTVDFINLDGGSLRFEDTDVVVSGTQTDSNGVSSPFNSRLDETFVFNSPRFNFVDVQTGAIAPSLFAGNDILQTFENLSDFTIEPLVSGASLIESLERHRGRIDFSFAANRANNNGRVEAGLNLLSVSVDIQRDNNAVDVPEPPGVLIMALASLVLLRRRLVVKLSNKASRFCNDAVA